MITKQIIENAGFLNTYQLENNIFYIKEFLSNEELNYANSLINDIQSDDWEMLNDVHHESWHNKFYDHNDMVLNKIIMEKINRIIINLPDMVVAGFNRVLRQSPGNNMDAHIDEINDQSNGSIREYALVVYLNDDYIGGDLSYVDLDISIKPEAGSLMIFKTGPKYLHEVKTVAGNTPRYCLPAFMFSSWPNA
jgi:hypothetical protein